MIFLRFWGCPLSCPWCDEPLHKDLKARREMNMEAILVEMDRIAPDVQSVLMTGGEPLAVQGLQELIVELKRAGKWLAMESSGHGGPLPTGLDWLTISPKQGTAPEVMERADELKFIVGANPNAAKKGEIRRWAGMHPNVWLQPLADGDRPGKAATATCVNLVLASGGRLRLSAQVHKYLEIP